jgi:hypothetical protein
MKRLLILIALLFLVAPLSAARLLFPQSDSLHSASATADTSRWMPVEVYASQFIIFSISRGTNAADETTVYIETSLDTAQLCETSAKFNTTANDPGNATTTVLDTLTEINGWKYWRMIRSIDVATGTVTMVSWILEE